MQSLHMLSCIAMLGGFENLTVMIRKDVGKSYVCYQIRLEIDSFVGFTLSAYIHYYYLGHQLTRVICCVVGLGVVLTTHANGIFD